MDVGLSLPDLADVSTEANWAPRASMVVAAVASPLRTAGGGAGSFIFSQPHIKALSLARRRRLFNYQLCGKPDRSRL